MFTKLLKARQSRRCMRSAVGKMCGKKMIASVVISEHFSYGICIFIGVSSGVLNSGKTLMSGKALSVMRVND